VAVPGQACCRVARDRGLDGGTASRATSRLSQAVRCTKNDAQRGTSRRSDRRSHPAVDEPDCRSLIGAMSEEPGPPRPRDRVNAQRRFSGLTKGSPHEMPSLRTEHEQRYGRPPTLGGAWSACHTSWDYGGPDLAYAPTAPLYIKVESASSSRRQAINPHAAGGTIPATTDRRAIHRRRGAPLRLPGLRARDTQRRQ
jgi:hypothetical protein